MAELTVGDIMERDPITVSPRADVSSLIKLLREHELPGMPVVEDDRTLVGIVTGATSCFRATQLMSRTGHNRIPVVDGARLVGVVTRVDALDALTRAGE